MATSHIIHSLRRLLLPFVALMLAATSLGAGIGSAAAQDTLLATQFFTAIGGGSAQPLFSAEAVLHTPEGEFTGQMGLDQFGNELGASFANLTFTTESVAKAGDLTIISFTISGINVDNYHGAYSDCASITVPAVAVLKITEQTVVSENWKTASPAERADLAPLQQVSQVTEQWIGYASDDIVHQIAVYNTIDPVLTRGCGQYFGS